MKKEKLILLFSDLEGTILKETDSQYDNEAMYQFLLQIDRLQELMDAIVNIHLVSPVYKKVMEKMIDKMDSSISRYNSLHPKSKSISLIEAGTFTPDVQMMGEEFLGNRVIPLKMPINPEEFDTSRYGKSNYVKAWCELYQESENKELIMKIYCGNGHNDLSAMDYIRKQQNGFVLCPSNSVLSAKKTANYTSDKTDLLGITDGIHYINNEIEKRISIQTENNKQILDAKIK